MSYFTEKLKLESKVKRIKIIFAIIGSILLLALCIFSAFVPARTWKDYVSKPEIEKCADGEMRLHFLDVGQGDAALIELPDGKIMLIDGGDGSELATKSLMRYLNALKIKTIDYLLVTHADSDHCGGLDVVLECKKVRNVYIPKLAEITNQEYAQFAAELVKEKACNVEYASRNVILSAEGAYPYTLCFLYPYYWDAEDETTEDNDSSAIVWIDYKGVSALFTGDATSEIENVLMRDDTLGLFEPRGVDLTSTEILKVAHHGSKYSTSEDFLEYLHTQTAVISCGNGNIYGHPNEETLQRLQSVNADVYRTDKNGNVVITIHQDGSYTTKCIPNK